MRVVVTVGEQELGVVAIVDGELHYTGQDSFIATAKQPAFGVVPAPTERYLRMVAFRFDGSRTSARLET